MRKTRRRKRIHDVLLMLLRAAVLLLVAVGLAGPAMTSLGALWGNANTAAVIILDNSASMGAIDAAGPRFESARTAAAAILDQLADGDQAALLLTCGPAFPDGGKLDRSQESVREILGQCRVSYERADLPRNLQQAREVLAKSDAPNKQIYILTDMQRVSWLPPSALRLPPSALPLPPSPFPLIVIDCNRAPKPNVAVQAIDVQATLPINGLPVKATVTLLNTSSVAQQRLVELMIDGVRQSVSPELDVPPLGPREAGISCWLSIAVGCIAARPGSSAKTARSTTIAASSPSTLPRPFPVAVVESRRHEIPYLDDAYYLDKVLASGAAGSGAIDATTILVADLPIQSLEKYKVVFCVNLPALGVEAADRLADYVAGGGRVVWICGDNVVPAAYNQMNQRAGGRLLPAPLVDVRTAGSQKNRDSWHIDFFDKAHPALSNLVEPASLYQSVLIYRHIRIAAAGGTRVLARLDDGEPLLVERSVEKGRVLMLGASMQRNWSNLPLRPIFLPFVTQLTFNLAESQPIRTSVIAGQPLVLPLSQASRPTSIEVIRPGGERLRLIGSPACDFRYTDTHEIGIYTLRQLDAAPSRETAYSVNFDPDEADPATIGQKELREQLGGVTLIFADNPENLSATFTLLREGKSLSQTFLAAVLIALVFETFLSNRFSRKQEEGCAV